MRNRHVDLLVNPDVTQALQAKSLVIQTLRWCLLEDGFLEVQTPILASDAGGASARPFTAKATEFAERNINLRIAPELWLKRMVIGGFDRVFEIGPCFRNEGRLAPSFQVEEHPKITLAASRH